MDRLIENHAPGLWIHGHTPAATTKKRTVCNPLGYPGERFVTFDPGMTVEV